MSAISGVTQDARDLAQRADQLRAHCEVLAASTGDEATRATLARMAGRLASSVVRPLGPALENAAEPAEAAAPGSEAELADALHRLALDGTRLRVRAPAAPSVQEAAAALQDLACQAVANDVSRLQARRTELATLMEGLRPAIQSAPNGPYLVTNVARTTDWLGVQLDPTPQAALCRCGASAIKPWCDGSHAQIGFEDAKSPDRVANQLDRYRGIGVEIADNRGTCAHSGFCTDRAPTVFRTSGEPFVAPAGGRVDEILRAGRDCPSGALSTALDGDPVGQSDTEREPSIEVSKDGPYRITGAIELLDRVGSAETWLRAARGVRVRVPEGARHDLQRLAPGRARLARATWFAAFASSRLALRAAAALT